VCCIGSFTVVGRQLHAGAFLVSQGFNPQSIAGPRIERIAMAPIMLLAFREKNRNRLDWTGRWGKHEDEVRRGASGYARHGHRLYAGFSADALK
jgi:hypothetical protein